MNGNLNKYIQQYLRARKKSGLLRKLNSSFAEHPSKNLYLNLNDYLQLSRHPLVIQAAQKALETWGTSCGGSPAVGSYWPIHQELEKRQLDYIALKVKEFAKW